ncbi:TetR/AcrR family transcriptional regulator [Nocardia sp. BMG111209]|uniref:TetR/AcrR family transcriptional regulator n=1 Tax=Nocardia sp. BMG111209 TaxID=1160137 RepID=UPI00036A35E7|nr:TetR/AcrR family transcriptional regulator [Nocardia sp. BMG111209]
MSGRREEILDAAVAIADEHGLDAVSMRAVADRVGVTPMALYRHIADKSALLDGLVGRLLASLLPADAADLRWDRRLTALAHAARALARSHPWAAQLLFSRPATTPDGARVVDEIYTALLAAGVPDAEVPRLERLVSTFVLGFVASEASGRFAAADDRRIRRGAVADGPLTGHARLTPWLRLPVDLTAEFEADLRDLMHVIGAVAGTGDR